MERSGSGIRAGVRGPGGESGFLLIAPPSEALDWDVQEEIGTTSRYWMSSHQAWWIAAPYRATASRILARLEPPPRSSWQRVMAAFTLSKELRAYAGPLLDWGDSRPRGIPHS